MSAVDFTEFNASLSRLNEILDKESDPKVKSIGKTLHDGLIGVKKMLFKNGPGNQQTVDDLVAGVQGLTQSLISLESDCEKYGIADGDCTKVPIERRACKEFLYKNTDVDFSQLANMLDAIYDDEGAAAVREAIKNKTSIEGIPINVIPVKPATSALNNIVPEKSHNIDPFPGELRDFMNNILVKGVAKGTGPRDVSGLFEKYVQFITSDLTNSKFSELNNKDGDVHADAAIIEVKNATTAYSPSLKGKYIRQVKPSNNTPCKEAYYTWEVLDKHWTLIAFTNWNFNDGTAKVWVINDASTFFTWLAFKNLSYSDKNGRSWVRYSFRIMDNPRQNPNDYVEIYGNEDLNPIASTFPPRDKSMQGMNESTKFTLTIGQLKKLIAEANVK